MGKWEEKVTCRGEKVQASLGEGFYDSGYTCLTKEFTETNRQEKGNTFTFHVPCWLIYVTQVVSITKTKVDRIIVSVKRLGCDGDRKESRKKSSSPTTM